MNTRPGATQAYYAVDLGAGSGRAMVVRAGPQEITLSECYRFANAPVLLGGELYWDFPRLFENLKEGLRNCRAAAPGAVSLAIDSWGTDFGLVTRSGALAGLPYSYRQFSDDGMLTKVRAVIPDSELYGMTGTQFMPVNTLYQLVALRDRHPELLAAADRLLLMPDLLNFFLVGDAAAEYTIASTSQFLNPASETWETRIFERLGLPVGVLPPLVRPGAALGRLLPEQAAELGLPDLMVRACAAHDTASAVAAVPVRDDGLPWAFISSGTWSLVGVEIPRPLLTEDARRANATNEAGVCGTTRLLKNVTGLWLAQRLRHDLALQGQELDHEALASAAAAAPAFQRFIAPNAPAFHNPPSMLAAITDFCLATGQPPPQSPGEYARCIFESLAFSYAEVLAALARLVGMPFARVHIIGGGAQNAFLNVCRGQCLRGRGRGRAARSNGHRQRAGAGYGRWSFRHFGRGQAGGGTVIPCDSISAARPRDVAETPLKVSGDHPGCRRPMMATNQRGSSNAGVGLTWAEEPGTRAGLARTRSRHRVGRSKSVGVGYLAGTDLPRIQQTGMYSHPLIPGHEFSGIVSASRSGAVAVGQQVAVLPIIPCGRCPGCQIGPFHCTQYDFIGSRRDGGFAEYCAVPDKNLPGAAGEHDPR